MITDQQRKAIEDFELAKQHVFDAQAGKIHIDVLGAKLHLERFRAALEDAMTPTLEEVQKANRELAAKAIEQRDAIDRDDVLAALIGDDACSAIVSYELSNGTGAYVQQTAAALRGL